MPISYNFFALDTVAVDLFDSSLLSTDVSTAGNQVRVPVCLDVGELLQNELKRRVMS